MAVRTMAIVVEADMLKNRVTHVSELENTELFKMAKSGNVDAKREMMRREIMYVDGVSHADTTATLLKISTLAEAGLGRVHASGKVMIFGAQAIGWGSIPLVFSLQASSAFNEYFVTAEPPEHGDTDTWLEVGAWSWNWMEPPLSKTCDQPCGCSGSATRSGSERSSGSSSSSKSEGRRPRRALRTRAPPLAPAVAAPAHIPLRQPVRLAVPLRAGASSRAA
jgi:hypothetical protein